MAAADVPKSGKVDVIITGSAPLEKTDNSRLELTGASTYTGATSIGAGTIAVPDFGNGSTASPLGVTPLSDPSKLVISAGSTLEFTGTTATATARSFTVSGSAGIATGAGAAPLTFTADAKVALTGAAPELKLVANNSGTNVFRASLSDADIAAGKGLSSLVIDGTGTWVIGGSANRFKQDIRIDAAAGATLGFESGSLGTGNTYASSVIAVANGATLAWSGSNTDDISSRLSIPAGATAKLDMGSNNVVFSSAPAVGTGGATIEKTGSGALKIDAAVSAPTLNVAVSTGLVSVNGTVGNVSISSGATLGGSGTVGNVTTAAGAHVSPGNSPGTLTTGNFGFVGGTYYDWQIQDALETTVNPGYDKLVITGNLDLRGAAADNKIILSVISLSDAHTVGNPLNFDKPGTTGLRPITFTFATVGGNVLLNSGVNISDVFQFDVSQFTYSDGSASDAALWSINWDGGSLVTITAVPEPSTYGFGLGALALAAAAIRRRKRQAKA